MDRKRRQAAIAEAIRDELAARAVPPKWLVENAELAVNTVSGILMKGSMPHADTTAAIEAAFGWEPGELAQRAANTVIVKPGGLTVVIPASVVAGLSGLQLEEVSLIARLAAIERVRVYHASGDVAPPPR